MGSGAFPKQSMSMTRSKVALLALCAAACGAPAPVGPAPTPAPVAASGARPQPLPPAPPVPAASGTEPARDWQLLDETTDRVAGVSSEKALRELLAGRQPKRTTLVAIIDGGIDTAH